MSIDIVIDGRRFRSATSKKIHHAESACNCTDFRYWSETLYRSPKGQLWIAGEGGALSHYSRPHADGKSGSSGGRLLDEAEASGWLEHNDAPLSAYEAAGVEIVEG